VIPSSVRMSRALLAALTLLTAACTSTAGSSTSPIVTCEVPPPREVASESALQLTVSPNPAGTGQVVELTVSGAGLPEDSVVGVDAAWQCWAGSTWVTTHIVYRGFGDNAGQTIPVNSEFQIRIPSIGLALDQGYPIVVPRVEAGIYRIEDDVLGGGASIIGFTFVEVIES
jgi:hypothetical protein